MTPLEQVAFGWQCVLGAASAGRRRETWAPWALLFGLQVLAIVLLAWSAHPALSWVMAPLLRWAEGDEVLRYPGLYRRLPQLARDAGIVLGAFVLPVLAGISARLFERAFRGAPARSAAAWSEGAARAGALLLAALPLTLAALGLHTALGAQEHVRLSGVARSLAPFAAGAALLFVRAALAYVPALVVLGGRGAAAALAEVPATWPRGFVPAAVALLLLSPLPALGAALSVASAALVDRGTPELVAALVLARAVLDVLGAMLASGALTLAWLGTVEAPAEDA